MDNIIDTWRESQDWELNWWKTRLNQRELEMAHEISHQILSRMWITDEMLAGKIVLDVGSGPTGRIMCVRPLASRMLAIEPLAEEYMQITGVSRILDTYDKIYSVPAEELVQEIVGKIDVAICLNVIDHCFDAEAVFRNVFSYLSPEGTALISFDVNKCSGKSIGHPISMTDEEARRAIAASGLCIIKEDHGRCFPSSPQWRTNWGEGEAYHWLCRKA